MERSVQFHSDAQSLGPTAFRCNSMATSQFDVDRSCIFLSFPYFLLTREGGARTLLQSHNEYPDKSMQESRQSINDLNDVDGEAVKMCVASPSCDAQKSLEGVQCCMIYVPEMWAIMSLSKSRTQAATRRTKHEQMEHQWTLC